MAHPDVLPDAWGREAAIRDRRPSGAGRRRPAGSDAWDVARQGEAEAVNRRELPDADVEKSADQERGGRALDDFALADLQSAGPGQ